MSSPDKDEGPVSRAVSHSECGERAGTVGLALGTLQSSKGQGEGEGEGEGEVAGEGEVVGEGGFLYPEGFPAQQHVMETGGLEPQDWEGQTGSLADFEGNTAAYSGSRSPVGIPQGLTDGGAQGVHRSPSPETCDREVSTIWLDPEPAPSDTGVVAHGSEGLQLASGAPFHLREPKGGRAWESPPKCARCRSKASISRQLPFEEEPDFSPWPLPKSSDEVSEMHLMRLIISQEEGGQAKPTSPSDTLSHSRTHIREKFLPVPGPYLSSTPQQLTSGAERQAVGDPEVPSRKPGGMIRGKAGSRPSCLPLVAATGDLPKATPRRKASKQKTPQQQASEVVPASSFPSWWQRDSGGPGHPAIFPPISEVLLPRRSRRHSLVPFGTKESKPMARRARRRRVSKPVVGEGEDKEQKRDGFPEGQSPTQEQRPSFPCGHRRARFTGMVNNKHTQDAAYSEPLALSEGEVLPSGPAPSNALEPPEELPRPERLQQPQPQQEQPRGAEACPQCEELQRGMHILREQVEIMQSLIEKLLRH